LRITAIDIGTNTVLMLIADLGPNGRIRALRDEIAFPRLGKGIDRSGLISRESIGRLLSVLRHYRNLSDDSGSERIIAGGTSALRDARNRDEVIKRISGELSMTVEVLSGEEEARWTFIGALTDEEQSATSLGRDDRRFAVLDIGGGSTEITLGTPTHADQQHSFDIGCVRLTERFLQSSPPTPEELELATASVRRALVRLGHIDPERYRLVGVAGTLTTLAALDQNLSRLETARVHGHDLTLERVRKTFEQIRIQTAHQLQSSPIISSGRADVLLAGILILIEFMTSQRFNQITVSDRGLRYGLLMREFERMEKSRKEA
jgi:exopolyphosphatase/guanosine-5'-triphosphate,3'-diphosphate pyrophosphatase